MKSISYVSETTITAPIDFPGDTPVTVCLRTSETYLKRESNAFWANARFQDRTVHLTAEEVGEKASLVGHWTVTGLSWGLEFSGPKPTLILDLEKAA
jgi:hypothetical protein